MAIVALAWISVIQLRFSQLVTTSAAAHSKNCRVQVNYHETLHLLCSLRPCVRSYAATVTAGILDEKEVDRTPWDSVWGKTDQDAEGFSYLISGILDLTCINSEERQALQRSGYTIEDSEKWLPYNVTFNPADKIPDDLQDVYPRPLLTHHCLYLMDALFMGSLWDSYLYYYFNGTIQGQYAYGTRLTMLEGPQPLQTMYNYGDIDFARVEESFANISDSLTNHIRENGNINQSVTAAGQVLHYATCLDVQWSWVAFPASMVAISIVFCILTILTVAVKKSEIWKSSQLTMVYNGPYVGALVDDGKYAQGFSSGVERETKPTISLPRSIRKMEDAAQSSIVRLDKHEGKLKLSENQIKIRKW